MELTKISTEGSRITFKVALDAHEYSAMLAQYGQASAQGFSDEASEDVREKQAADIAGSLCAWALAQEGIVPVCAPEWKLTDNVADPDGLELLVRVFPQPRVEISSFDPVEVTLDAPVVTSADVDKSFNEVIEVAREQGTLLPDQEVTDEWVSSHVPDCDTIADLREKLHKVATQLQEQEFTQYAMSVVTHAFSERVTSDIPADTVRAMAVSMVSELERQLQTQQTTLEELAASRGTNRAELESGAQSQAAEMLLQSTTLDAIYRHFQLEVTDDDRQAALLAMAPGHVKELQEKLDHDAAFAAALEQSAARMKAGAYVLRQAHITLRRPNRADQAHEPHAQDE